MSLLNTLLRPKSLPTPSIIAACSRMTTQHNYTPAERKTRRCANQLYGGDDTSRRGGRGSFSGGPLLEEVFINALVAAGSCRRCEQPLKTGAATRRPALQSTPESVANQYLRTGRRSVTTSTRDKQSLAVALPPEPEGEITRDDYRELVNTYNSPSDLWNQPSPRTRHQRRQQPATQPAIQPTQEHVPLAPRIVITPEQEDSSGKPTREILPPESKRHATWLRGLERLLRETKLGERTNDIWHMYSATSPRSPRYLTDAAVHRLLQHLAWVEFKDIGSSKRYIEFLDEALNAGIEPTAAEWNTAVSFAGRWARKVTSDEVKAAVKTWMRMETTGKGVKPTHVTFNILFDIASRAGRFALADTIRNELKAREMPRNRYYRTSMIHDAGLRRDGHAVRTAFRELVDAGEIVDTAVMNCVILALLHAGEASSAENVFQKMKTLHAEKHEATARQRNWREERELGRSLDRAAYELRKEKTQHESSFFGSKFSNEEHKETVQRGAPIHPNARTCRILLKHHCLVSGNLERVRDFMAEMRTEACGGVVTGIVYLDLFAGFRQWGGHARTVWTRASLEQYWEEFLEAVERGKLLHPPSAPPGSNGEEHSPQHPATDNADTATPDDTSADDTSSYRPFTLAAAEISDRRNSRPEPEAIPYEDRPVSFSSFMCSRVIHAFYKCAGPKRVLAVWKQIQERWTDMSEDERVSVRGHVERVVRDDYTL